MYKYAFPPLPLLSIHSHEFLVTSRAALAQLISGVIIFKPLLSYEYSPLENLQNNLSRPHQSPRARALLRCVY